MADKYVTRQAENTENLPVHWVDKGTGPNGETYYAEEVTTSISGSVSVTGEVEVKNDSGNPIPVTGTVSVNEPVSVDDNGGSLTVDGTVALDSSTLAALEHVGVTADAAFPVTDNGGSLTVDGSVSISGTAPTTAAQKLTIASAGTTTIVTPTAGHALRLKWVYLKTPLTNPTEIDVTVKLGSTTVYRTSMGQGDIFSHTPKDFVDGATNAALTVTVGDVLTAVTYPVIMYVDFDYKEL